MKKRIPFITIFIILLPVIITDITQVRSWKAVINADGYGYYAYLPTIFIYHSFDFTRIQKEEIKLRGNISADEVGYPFIPATGTNNKIIDKYFIGTSILLLPFFLLAYFLSYLLGFDLSGYSILFQESVALAAVVYLLLGLILLRKLLLSYKIPDIITYIALAGIVYGTSLFYYTVSESSLSHVYSFALCSAFLFFTKKSIENGALKSYLLMVASLSILCIIRPTNLLIALTIPFIAGDISKLLAFLKKMFLSQRTFLLLLMACSIIGIQLLIWHAETGNWFIWSYGNEGFNFSHPHITDFLFSYRKGVFLYAPLLFIIMAISIGRQLVNRQYYLLFCLALFFIPAVYICSCWHQWWYGASFGMRPFIDFYPFFVLLFGLSLNNANTVWRNTAFAFCILCISLAIVQTIQYRKFIFSSDKMNKTRYWHIFLRTDDTYGWAYENPSSALTLFPHPSFSSDSITGNNSSYILKDFLHNGKHPILLTSQKHLVAEFNASSLSQLNNVSIYIKQWAYISNINYEPNLTIETIDKEGRTVNTIQRKFADDVAAANEWDKIEYVEPLPSLSSTDKIMVFEQSNSDSTKVDNITIQFGIKK